MLNFLSLEFPNTSIKPGRASSFRILHAGYEHEMYIIKFLNWNIDENTVKPGSPVKLVLRNSLEEVEKYGYIDHFKRVRRPDADYVEITAIGASYVLKNASQTVYHNTSASAVAKKLAKANKLAFDVKNHPRIYPQISQAGMSDWQLLVKLAKQCGYTVRVDGATLRFKPISEEYDQDRQMAPRFNMGSVGSPLGTMIYDFKLLAGENVDYGDARKSAVAVSGMDFKTGHEIAVTNPSRVRAMRDNFQPEFFDAYANTTVVPDYTAAKYEAEAADARNRFAYRAKATLIGTPSIHPNMPIYIDGVDESLDGVWMVISVEHTMDDYTYTTSVVIGTDSFGAGAKDALGRTPKPTKRSVRKVTPGSKSYSDSHSVKLTTDASPIKRAHRVKVSALKNRSADLPDTSMSLWVSELGDVRSIRD